MSLSMCVMSFFMACVCVLFFCVCCCRAVFVCLSLKLFFGCVIVVLCLLVFTSYCCCDVLVCVLFLFLLVCVLGCGVVAFVFFSRSQGVFCGLFLCVFLSLLFSHLYT